MQQKASLQTPCNGKTEYDIGAYSKDRFLLEECFKSRDGGSVCLGEEKDDDLDGHLQENLQPLNRF